MKKIFSSFCRVLVANFSQTRTSEYQLIPESVRPGADSSFGPRTVYYVGIQFGVPYPGPFRPQ